MIKLSKATQRLYDIILSAQHGKPIDEFDPPLNPEEIEDYKSIQAQCEMIKAQGREPMFELPVDYEPDDEYEDNNEPDEISDIIRGEKEE